LQNRYCKDVHAIYGISRGTILPYIKENPKTLNMKKRGRKCNVSQEAAELIIDVAVKTDSDNKGKSAKELKERLQRLHPELTTSQIHNTWRKTIHPKAKIEKRVTGLIVANATTSKRSAITVEQQFRFHTIVDETDAWIKTQNTVSTPQPTMITHSVPTGHNTAHHVTIHLTTYHPVILAHHIIQHHTTQRNTTSQSNW
jgi:hypothetical protein